MNDQLFPIGMEADEALRVIRKNRMKILRQPEQVGRDAFGMVVNWYTDQATIQLARTANPGPYRICQVGPPLTIRKPAAGTPVAGTPDAQPAKKTRRRRRRKDNGA